MIPPWVLFGRAGRRPYPHRPMRVAVLDLGSNSFRLQLSEVGRDGSIADIHQERQLLHLGGVVGSHGYLPDDSVRRAIATARELVDLAERIGCDHLFAVATAAFREAGNGPEVADLISAAIGTQVRVVDGLEEARLSFLGAQASVRLEPGPVTVLDLGGGSLEIAVGEGARLDRSSSHALGVSRLHASIGGDEVLSPSGRRLVAEAVANELANSASASDQVVAVGGAVRELARVAAKRSGAWLPDSVNHFRLHRDGLEAALDVLAPISAEERVEEYGINEGRAPDLPVAAAVLIDTMTALEVEEMVVSDWGLRMGVMIDVLDLPIPTGDEVWQRSAEALRRRFLADDPHPGHVAELLLDLWAPLSHLHGLDDDHLRVVVVAALLHDIGKSLSLDGHHRHSAYLAEHAHLRGLEPHELASALSLIRYHRGGPPRRRYPPFDALTPDDRRTTRRMAAILQLADALDRTRDGAVEQVVVADNGHALLLRLVGAGAMPPSGADSRLEYASDILGRDIEFIVEGGPA